MIRILHRNNTALDRCCFTSIQNYCHRVNLHHFSTTVSPTMVIRNSHRSAMNPSSNGFGIDETMRSGRHLGRSTNSRIPPTARSRSGLGSLQMDDDASCHRVVVVPDQNTGYHRRWWHGKLNDGMARSSSSSSSRLLTVSAFQHQHQHHRKLSTSTNNTFTTTTTDDPTSVVPPSWYHPERLVVSILGPPNAGKSTLFNRIMCKDANKAYRLSSDKDLRRPRRSKGRIGSKNPSKRQGGAIVSPVPGTTRDRRECIGRIGGTYFTLIDTAGVDGIRISLLGGSGSHKKGAGGEVGMEEAMIRQTLEAARQSDLILLMFDAKVGVTSDMEEVGRWLRTVGGSSPPNDDVNSNIDDSDPEKEGLDGWEEQYSGSHKRRHPSSRRVVVLANKLEGDAWVDHRGGGEHDSSPVMEHLSEVTRLGFGEAVPISAEYGEGLADLAVMIERMTEEKRVRLGLSPKDDNDDDDDNEETVNNGKKKNKKNKKNNPESNQTEKPLQLAILGRQNVGKSTLVNALLSTPRVISGPTPGLTRDAISINWIWNSRPVRLVDTAGLRRMARRDPDGNIEDSAVSDAMRAMKVADVAVLVLDGGARMLQRQELAICDAVVREGRALVVVANKSDLLTDGGGYTKEDYAEGVRRQIEVRFPMLRRTPVVPMSAVFGGGVEDLMPVVFTARDRWAQVVPTGELNRWLRDVVDLQAPPMKGGRGGVKLKYIVQTKGRPPTFLIFGNADSLPTGYMRYLLRNFQETFGMYGMGVRMAVKRSSPVNPYLDGWGKGSNANCNGGNGIGGKDARKKRMIRALKTTGQKREKGLRRRFQKKR